jgi:long-subunit fatty acid transport protein
MMRLTWMLSIALGLPLSAYAEEAVFEDSMLLGSGIIASSQAYQIKKLNCELAGLFSSGNMISKTMDLTMEAKSQGSSFHCGHSLEQNSLVLGVSGRIQQTMLDGLIVRYETLTTDYKPYLAFQLTSNFSLGISQEVKSGESKTMLGRISGSTHRLLLSGSWHEGPWEVTLVYGDRFRDTINPGLDIPRSLGLGVRHQVSPLLTAGFIYTRVDHPGIAYGELSLTFEHNYSAVITSRVTESVSVELSILHTQASDGDKDAVDQKLQMMGQYALNEEIKLGAFLGQMKGDSEAFDTTLAAYGFNVSMTR